MARAEMRIRVSIFFDPPRLRFQGGSARMQTQYESMTATAAADHVSPETRVSACSLAACLVSGIHWNWSKRFLIVARSPSS